VQHMHFAGSLHIDACTHLGGEVGAESWKGADRPTPAECRTNALIVLCCAQHPSVPSRSTKQPFCLAQHNPYATLCMLQPPALCWAWHSRWMAPSSMVSSHQQPGLFGTGPCPIALSPTANNSLPAPWDLYLGVSQEDQVPCQGYQIGPLPKIHDMLLVKDT